MPRKASLISVALLSTALATANKACAENWITTDRIINQREVRIQIDKNSIRRDDGNWITFMQRLQTNSNPPAKPFKGEVNCTKKVFGSIFSKNERQDQLRRNGKWFIDFAHKHDPSDVVSVEVDPKDDQYREKTFSWICSNYKK
jgi:Fe-S cluster assembly iron-binding protein IscA